MPSETPRLQPIAPGYKLRILSDEQLARFQSATLEILGEVGIHCPSERTLKIYAEHGAKVDQGRQIVKLSPDVVLEAMSHAPRFYTVGARAPAFDLKFDGTAMFCATDGCGTKTIDFETRQRRQPRKDDVAKMALVSDYLSPVGFYWPMVTARDYPATASLHGLDASFRSTVKHVESEMVMDDVTARYAVEMARVIAGDKATLRQRPPLSLLVCCIAPLGQDGGGMEAALRFAEVGLPVGFMSMANAGSTGPATIAGTVALADAEIVAAMVLVQMAHPGTPTFHSLMPGIMHPRTGGYLSLTWETELPYPVGVELAHMWGVPALAAIFGPDAEEPGRESAKASASNLLMCALCGAETGSGMGLLEGCTVLYPEELVLDTDIYHQIRINAAGLDTSRKEFALDVIKAVGPRGHFLFQDHTRKQFRERQFSDITRQLGPDGGIRDPIEVAREKTDWILKNHQPEPLAEEKEAELDRILEAAAGELGQVWERNGHASEVDTGFTAALVDVFPGGHAHLVQEGIVRAGYRESDRERAPIEPGWVYAYTIDHDATSHVVQVGHRVRVETSSSNFDHYDRNPNNGQSMGTAAASTPARQQVFHTHQTAGIPHPPDSGHSTPARQRAFHTRQTAGIPHPPDSGYSTPTRQRVFHTRQTSGISQRSISVTDHAAHQRRVAEGDEMNHSLTPQIQPIEPQYHLRILSDEQLADFRSATLEILAEAGVHCPSQRAREIYAEHGAQVDFESHIVKLPPDVVVEAMSHAPRYYTMAARSEAHDLKLDGTAMYVATDGSGLRTIDFETGRRRPSVKDDVAKMARVADYLSSIGFYWPIVSATDHVYTAPLHELDASFNNTVKHVQTETAMGEKIGRYAVEMARVIAGNETTMRARPPLSLLVCTIAPLAQDVDGMESALVFAEAGLPVGFMSMAATGLTAPATVAGTMAIGDAEIVAAMVLIQMAYPGAPTYHSMMPGIMHPSTGDFMGSTMEADLFYSGGVELAHMWGVPTLAGVGTEAATSGWESAEGIASSMLLCALCGAETGSGLGLREVCTLLSPEALVLDSEIYHTVRMEVAGVDTSREALALDVIKAVGPRGHYLFQDHTRKMFRELRFSELTGQPQEGGGYRDPIEVAREKTDWILENHCPEPLAEEQQAELKRILGAAEGELG